MNLQHTEIKPSSVREPFFDGDNLDSGSYELKCSECGNKIEASCHSIYEGAWGIGENFTEQEESEIRKFYDFGKNNISLTRGWPSISKQKCTNCGAIYALVADFHEYRNSVYQIVIQGVAYVET